LIYYRKNVILQKKTMKKSLFIILIVIFYSKVLWSQNWVGLTRNEPAQPEITLTASNNQQVSFRVELSGFFSSVKTESGMEYQRLSIPGYSVTGTTGEPEIPVITQRIAIPKCNGVNYTVQIISSQTLSDYRIYPVPDLLPNSNGGLDEVFTVNSIAYLQNFFIPKEDYLILETGAMRNQHFVSLELHPLRYNPASGQLLVITQIEITLTFDNPTTDVNVPTGIFNNVATHSFLNYQNQGIKASINDKAFEKSGFQLGNVQWMRFTDTLAIRNLTADYLMICANAFFPEDTPHDTILRLANHRAFYNGFDVMILNVEDILSAGFYYEGNPYPNGNPNQYLQEQLIRTCIRTIYETGTATHTYDGHLGYVLLVGDVWVKKEDGKESAPPFIPGVPTSYEYGTGHYSNPVSDYYFSCITRDSVGKYDKVGDLYIGRFCVAPNLTNGLIELHNMIEKTIFFESEYSFGDWRNRAHFVNGTAPLPISYWNKYYPYITSLMHDQQFDSVNYYGHDYYDYGSRIVDLINKGSTLFLSFTHGEEEMWEFGLTTTLLKDSLINVNETPFCFAMSCLVGRFQTHKCLAQQMTSYAPDKGFVAMIAASARVAVLIPADSNLFFANPPERAEQRLPFAIYQNLSHVVGEIYLETFLNSKWSDGKEMFNIFGDPALNIMANGFEVTRSITVDTTTDISCHIKVHNNATVTIPQGGEVFFHTTGKLFIEKNGGVNIQKQVHLFGELDTVSPVIHVKGGTFTVGEDVVFQDLPGGILLENNGSVLYDNNKYYILDGVTFNNSPLTHKGSKFSGLRCTFNAGSNVTSNIGTFKIEDCIFNETTFLADHTVVTTNSMLKPNLKGTGIAILNSQFTGNDSNSAIQLINTQSFEIGNCTVSGYETGISLTNSKCNSPITANVGIHDNEVFNCNTGIEFYSSGSTFTGNNIHDNVHGIKLFNNSYTIFDNEFQPEQAIQDCDSIEIYACATSFPTIFRYNKIVDKNLGINLGIIDTIPLIYWDVEEPYPSPKERDIRYNCWGKGFDPSNYLHPSELLAWDSVWDCTGKSGAPTRGDDENLYQTGLVYFANEDYSNAETTFKELIETYPESRFAIAAMHELFALEHFTDNDFYKLYDYLTSFTPTDSNLFNVADFLATRCHVKEKNWQPAINWYENRIENPPSYQDSIFAVIDLGDIHLMMEKDTLGSNGAKASHCSYRLENVKPKSKQEYETNKTNLLATLPQTSNPKPQTPNLKPHTYRKGVLGECVPNPTNGNAMIYYEIFTEGVAEIRIYNAMGQLVKSVEQKTSIGRFKSKISFAGFPAGLYHYTLFVNGERTDSKKLIINH